MKKNKIIILFFSAIIFCLLQPTLISCTKKKMNCEVDSIIFLSQDLLLLRNNLENIKEIYRLRGSDTIEKYTFDNKNRLIEELNGNGRYYYASTNYTYQKQNIIGQYNGDSKYTMKLISNNDSVYFLEKTDTTYILNISSFDCNNYTFIVRDLSSNDTIITKLKYSNKLLCSMNNRYKTYEYNKDLNYGVLTNNKNRSASIYYFSNKHLVDSIKSERGTDKIFYKFWKTNQKEKIKL